MRIMGLDVGERTIGVAVSDALQLTAQGVTTIRRQAIRKDLHALRGFIEQYEVAEIVVGLPRNMDGSSGPQAEKALAFAEKLRTEFGLPVETYDERLTTAMAEKMLIGADVSRARRREVIDKLAAQIILQGYLDRKSARN